MAGFIMLINGTNKVWVCTDDDRKVTEENLGVEYSGWCDNSDGTILAAKSELYILDVRRSKVTRFASLPPGHQFNWAKYTNRDYIVVMTSLVSGKEEQQFYCIYNLRSKKLVMTVRNWYPFPRTDVIGIGGSRIILPGTRCNNSYNMCVHDIEKRSVFETDIDFDARIQPYGKSRILVKIAFFASIYG